MLGLGLAILDVAVSGGSHLPTRNFVTDFAAVNDMQVVVDTITIANGSPNLSSSASHWVSGDVGKQIRVNGAASGPNVLVSTIKTVTDGSHIILNDNATNGLSGSSQRVLWGTDNTAALTSFNAAWQGLGVNLVIPPGGYLFSPNGGALGRGVKTLVVSGYGATVGGALSFSSNGVTFLGDGGASAFVQTVSAGANSVSLVNSGFASIFSVGQFCLLASLDTQGFGAPPNPFFYEYLSVKSIVGGVITFNETIANTHKSTYPCYDPGFATQVAPSLGGPANLYALPSDWNTDATYQGLTIVTDTGRGMNAFGRKIAFVDCSGPDSGPFPSVSQSWTANNFQFPNLGMEVDKIIGTLNFGGGSTLHSVITASPSPRQLNVTGGCSFGQLQNGGQNISTSGGNNLGSVVIGNGGFGHSLTWSSTGDTMTSITVPITVAGISGGIEGTYTFDASGTFALPLFSLPIPWAVPGAWNFLSGQQTNEGQPFKVTDVTTDGTSTYATLSITSGTKNLSSTTNLWVAGDLNKPIRVNGAGAAGGNLTSTIATVTDAQHVVLADNASTTLTASVNNFLQWGSAYAHTTLNTASAAWNSSDVNAGTTISNNGLTAKNNSGAGSGVRSTGFISSLVYAAAQLVYWEETVDVNSAGALVVGVANTSWDETTSLQSTANAVGYKSSGTLQINGVGTTIATFAAGNRIGFALDRKNKKLWARVQGGNWNNDILANQNPATNTGGFDISAITGNLRPAFWATTTNDQITAKFASSSWTDAAPAGFTAVPALPNVPRTGNTVGIIGLPVNSLTMANCSGCADAVDLSQPGAQGLPIYSYTKRTITPSASGTFTIFPNAWGTLVSIKMNVTKRYTGTQPSITFSALANTQETDPNFNIVLVGPAINLLLAGERDLFPSSTSGTQSLDSLSAFGIGTWSRGAGADFMGTDISGESSAVWPNISIEVATNQGIS